MATHLIPNVFFTFCLIVISFSCNSDKSNNYNLSFESVKKKNYELVPDGWHISNGANIDTSFVQNGKYSLRLHRAYSGGNFVNCSKVLAAPTKGTVLKLTGYIKSENVKKGFGGLWLKSEDANGNLIDFVNMHTNGVTNTTNWSKYSIEISINTLVAKKILFGAYLSGIGVIWVDNLELTVDNISVKKVTLQRIDSSSNFNNSGINKIQLTKQSIENLSNLGMIWGFLKYHHPSVIKGNYNWDAELFNIIPRANAASSNKSFNQLVENWINSLGEIEQCENCNRDTLKIQLKPSYGYLFSKHNLSSSIVSKLANILENYKGYEDQHYIGQASNIKNPVFKNEMSFANAYSPDAGLRLLALYRYWNMIQYFFPYRHLISSDWNKVLSEFIPCFVEADTRAKYVLACLELVSKINDTHANIGNEPILDSLKGLLITPFQAKFVEKKLIVTGYYNDVSLERQLLKRGDIIEEIDGIKISALIKKFSKYTPASNRDVQLKRLASAEGFLLRGNKKKIKLLVRRDNNLAEYTVSKIPLEHANISIDNISIHETRGYKKINAEIGYIYPALLKETDLDSIKVLFSDTKGVIVDLRCYPSTFMPYTYGEWLKPTRTPFVHITHVSLKNPGAIVHGIDLSNGGAYSNSFTGSTSHYNGNVVILVNASTISQAEFTTMALSTTPHAVVIGSTTAGADGNISTIILPGKVFTNISGTGVYYPDLTETQGVGIKINIECRPTIQGIKEGRDELLEKGIELIKKHRP